MINDTLFVLVVEDNPGDFFLVKEYLEESAITAQILHATTLANALQLLSTTMIDVVLLDLSLPDSQGLDTFNSLHTNWTKLPIIVLTGYQDTSVALEALKLGAQDYLVKDDCNPMLLSKSIKYGIERSKTFEQLRRSEEQYKYLFDSNPLPMWSFSLEDYRYLKVNKAACKHYGYSENEFLSMSIFDVMHENQQEIVDSIKLHLAKHDLTYHLDATHRTKSGQLIQVEVARHITVTSQQEAVLSVINDVTERNEAREKLRQSEQMFRTISENFPNGGVAILDSNYKVIYIAGSDTRIALNPVSTILHTSFLDHFSEPLKGKIFGKLVGVFKGNSTAFEAKVNQLTYIVSAVPLSEPNKSIPRILLAWQNISVQKKNEAEKELLIEELKQTNSDLRQFSYITSHNLRSPLSNLLGIIKLLDTSTISDPTTTLLFNNFKDCTLQLNDTVNDLINVLIIKNNANTQKEPLSISHVLDRVISSMQNSLDVFDVSIAADFTEVEEIKFNRSYLESILLNLLTNAIKYRSPHRKPEIHIYTKRLMDEIKLYFADNGLGIDMARYKDRIFGLYQRFHDHEDSKGLGLYIVNSQVRAMGGDITVESDLEKGTTFIITLKLTDDL